MRLGKYTGKIYSEDEAKTMEECGLCITDEQANDEEFLKERRVRDLKDCIGCFGCPASNR